MQHGHQFTADLLGIDIASTGWNVNRSSLVTAVNEATDARAQVLSLALVLGAIESTFGVHTWRSYSYAGGSLFHGACRVGGTNCPRSRRSSLSPSRSSSPDDGGKPALLQNRRAGTSVCFILSSTRVSVA